MILSELESLEGIRGRIRRSQAMIDRLNEQMDGLEGFNHSEGVTAKIKSTIEQYDSDIEALKLRRREIIRHTEILPEKQRKILLLRYDGGLTWPEIADALGYSVRNVQRAREAVIE